MARREFSLDMDDGGSAAFAGYVAGFAATVSNRRYIDAVVDDVSTDLGVMFNQAVDQAARLDPLSYQHVYESGKEYPTDNGNDTIGNPTERLWRLTFAGSGGRRRIGFTFLPSTRPVPIHPQLLKPGGKKRRHVLPNVHVFTWKAPIMEYGLRVTISPQLSPKKFLAFVDDETGKTVFTQKTINATPGDLGDRGSTINKFTALYVAWWTHEAAGIFDMDIKPRLERELITEADIAAGVGHRARRTKTVTMHSDSDMEFRAAERRARAEWQGRAHNHIGKARQRRLELYGY